MEYEKFVSDLVSELRRKNYDVDYQKYTRNGINQEHLVWHYDGLETGGLDLDISNIMTYYGFISLDDMVELIIDELEDHREKDKKSIPDKFVTDLVSELRRKNYDVYYEKRTREGINEENLVWWDDNLATGGVDINIGDLLTWNRMMSLDDMVQLIIDEFENEREKGKKLDKEFILDNIRIALRNPVSDYTVKKDTPFKNVQQYLCLFEVDHGIGPNMKRELCMYDTFLKEKGISIEEAWARAEENNRQKIDITTPDRVYMSIDRTSMRQLSEMEQYAYEKIEMYFVTNDEIVHGAASILNTDALKEALENAVNDMKPSFFAENNITTDALKSGATKWQVFFISKDKAILVPGNANDLTRAALEIVMKKGQRGLQKEDKISDEIFEIEL